MGDFTLKERCVNTIVKSIIEGHLRVQKVRLDFRQAEEILRALIQHHTMDDSKMFNKIILSVFQDSERMPLRQMNFENAVHLTNHTLKVLLKANPSVRHLDLRGCRNITNACFSTINQLKNLESLIVMDQVLLGYFPNQQIKLPSLKRLDICDGRILNNSTLKANIFRLLYRKSMNELLEPVLKNLTYLDLSGFSWVKYLKGLAKATQLETLIMHNTNIQPPLFQQILQLKNLKVLDISVTPNRSFQESDKILLQIIESLPDLESLDISGRDICGSSLNVEETNNGCGIPSLISRVNNPLQFLGLYGTPNRTCRMKDIPALEVSGDGDETQLMNALKHNMNRPEVLTEILADLLKVKNLTVQDALERAALLCQLMMNRNLEGYIQKRVLDCLFQAIAIIPKIRLDRRLKESIFKGIFLIIKNHFLNGRIIEVTYDILKRITNPDDIAFDFKTFSRILLSIDTQSMDLQTFGIVCSLRGLLTCSNNKDNIDFLCELGMMEKSLEFLLSLHWRYQSYQRMVQDALDSIITIWETIENLVKKSDEGCRRFAVHDGLNCVHWYLKWYPQDSRLQKDLRRIVTAMKKSPWELGLTGKKIKKTFKCLKDIEKVLNSVEKIQEPKTLNNSKFCKLENLPASMAGVSTTLGKTKSNGMKN